MKIAWFTPFCRASAIGQYSAIILDHLARDHEVVVYATGLGGGAESWRPAMPTVRIASGGGVEAGARAAAESDIAVYNLGDNFTFHEDIYRASLAAPGVAVVHDASTWNFHWGRHALQGGAGAAWLEEMQYAHGETGAAWGRMMLAGRATPEMHQEGAMRWTMGRSTVRGALGAVVHGRQARERLAAEAPLPVECIDFPSPALPDPGETPPMGGRVRLLSFGRLNANKAPDLVVRAIAASPLLRERCEYTLAGDIPCPALARQIDELIRDGGLGGCVRLVPRPDDATLHRLIAESDVLINLRYPHLGECSWSLAEGLWLGKPVVVWGHGYYDEFPDDVVCKVTGAAGLTAALEGLVSDPDERLRRGRRARAHARARFDTAEYCRRLLAFIEACRSARPVAALAGRLGAHLATLFGGCPAALAARLAEEVAVLAPAGCGDAGRAEAA